jgi:hypothetical protein
MFTEEDLRKAGSETSISELEGKFESEGYQTVLYDIRALKQIDPDAVLLMIREIPDPSTSLGASPPTEPRQATTGEIIGPIRPCPICECNVMGDMDVHIKDAHIKNAHR